VHKEYIRIVENSDFAVLMLHGIVGTPDHFKEFIPLVPQNWSVYNLLLDGHGGTVSDFSKTSMKKWQAQINSVLDEIFSRHKTVLILAHSMGTLFAIDAAIRFPERVKYLFLLCVPLLPRVTFKAAVTALRLALGIAKENDELAAAMKADTSITLERNLFKYLGWVPRYLELFRLISKIKKVLGELTVQGVCFGASHDELVWPAAQKILKKRTALTCHSLESSGHFVSSREDMAILKEKFSEMIYKFEEDCYVQRNSEDKAENRAR